MSALIIVALVAAAAGLVSTIISNIRTAIAERELVEAVRKGQDDIIEKDLKKAQKELSSKYPDSADLATAVNLLSQALKRAKEQEGDSGQPKGREPEKLLRTLVQGSDKSKANYIIKLIEESNSEKRAS